MSETKSHQFRPRLYHDDATHERAESEREAGADRGREQQGWDAYRKWLSSMNGQPRSRRATIDHSIYSWKGYNSWADRIRQSWKGEDS